CFFPAADGIRGFHVTGVQTCALPISLQDAGDVAEVAADRRGDAAVDDARPGRGGGPGVLHRVQVGGPLRRGRGEREGAQVAAVRSEERRVGEVESGGGGGRERTRGDE